MCSCQKTNWWDNRSRQPSWLQGQNFKSFASLFALFHLSHSVRLSWKPPIRFASWLGPRLIATARSTLKHTQIHTLSQALCRCGGCWLKQLSNWKNKEWMLLMIRLQIDSRSCRSSPRSSACDRHYPRDHHLAGAAAGVTSFEEMIAQKTAPFH